MSALLECVPTVAGEAVLDAPTASGRPHDQSAANEAVREGAESLATLEGRYSEEVR
ncbi:hypothetical protein [Curtobacterium sp. MCJR17_020]|uniref:hypothetical protein n=1 Tax=Curtobacterium sp. MCJR17_020 TaxID=2175619 RepID=UPI0015E88AA1|nr:hypothetical protein [Curtobacterium sp. MCJR17_020]WIE72354.1 hypothetical protein DEJ14_000945 [Curtobacterium sp. MCJR17_020]